MNDSRPGRLGIGDTVPATGRKHRRVDPLLLAVGLFFVIAVAAAAYPALRTGPSVPGMALLIGLAAVCFLGLFAFVRFEAPAEPGLDANLLTQSLEDPACVVSADGRLVAM